MSEFVEIRTSVSDIMNTANRLKTQGDELAETIGTTNERITGLENHPETLPDDDFTREFKKTYHASVEGADGTSLTANEAVKQSGVQMGTAMTSMGDSVVNAMWSYSGTDDDNATEVNSANQT